MESFFIKVLKSPRSYDFLKQIELDYIVHNMKKFQEPGGGGGTAIYGLYRYVPLWRVWFSSSLLRDRVYKSERLGVE